MHVILVWCAIFNLPCCNNVQVMKRRHVWVLCGIQGTSTSALRYCWDQFYNRHPDNQIDSILLNLLPSYELLNTSFKLQIVSPGSSLFTKLERKITAESVRAQLAAAAAEGALLACVPPSCLSSCRKASHTGEWCGFTDVLEKWIQIIRNRKWSRNHVSFSLFLCSFLKPTGSKNAASEVTLVKQYFPDAKPLKCLPLFKKKPTFWGTVLSKGLVRYVS